MDSIKNITQKDSEGREISYRIEQIKNGFVVSANVEWNDKQGRYHSKNEKMFFEENPFDDNVMSKFDIIKKALKNS